jgi:arabinogalactan oligomer/maltooligosaccharide transport system permease protein
MPLAAPWALALAGPLVGAAAAAPVELRLWHAYRGDEKAALEAIVAEWDEAQPDVTVDVLAIPPDGFVTKFEAAAPRGNGPDLLIAAHERVGGWVGAGLIAPLGAGAEGLHLAAVAALGLDGEQYGLPLAVKTLALFWNRALIAEPPATTGALRALRGQLPEGVYPLAYQAAEPYFHAAWMHGFGGGAMNAAGEVALDQPGNAAAFGFARALIEEGTAPDEATGVLVTQLFRDGRAATVINGPWFLGELGEGVDFGVAPLPVIDEVGARARPYLTVEALMLSAHAAAPEPARALAAHLVAPGPALRRAVGGRQAVATLAALDAPEVREDPVLAAFAAQLDAALPMPNSPEMARTWEPMARGLRRALRGAQDPEAAARSAQTEYEIVSRPGPPPADPRPWLAAAALLAVVGLVAFARRAWAARAEVRAHALAYAWVAPAALGMAALVVAPFAVGAAVSLFDHTQGRFTFVGLANFLDILLARDWPITSPLSFYLTLGVTVLWTACNVALHVTIGVALALLLRDPWLRLRGLYRVILIIPWAIPNYITALIWKGMFQKQFGAVNAILGLFGVEPISWFSRFSTAFAANLTTNTWLGFPFMMVVTLGALQAIPRDLEQAAEVDGATGWQRFRHVTLPLLTPALLPAVVLGSVWTFNMFNIIYLVSGGEPDGASEILISEAYRWAFTRGHRYGYAAAYAVLVFGVLLVWSRASDRLVARVRG